MKKIARGNRQRKIAVRVIESIGVVGIFNKIPTRISSRFRLEFPGKVFTETPARISVKIPAVISRQDSR